MKYFALALCAGLCVGGCSKASSQSGNPNGGPTFDPCVPDPAPGYDPGSRNLKQCCDTGPAHCVPTSDVIATLASSLTACPDGASVCMPDPIIRAGGQFVPPSCTSSVGDAPGVCLSSCIPLVANNPQSAVLGQDGCGTGELCVPCNNPFNGTPTGACDLVGLLCGGGDGGTSGGGDGGAMCPYTGPPLLDPSTLAPCAPACGGAHCLPAQAVPAAQQSLLSACTANGGVAGLCTPDPLIESGGNGVPKTCTSVAGAEGRCLSTCLPSVAAQASLLPVDVCGSDEKCVPCFNPTAADPTAATGACSLACDKPASPPVVLSCPWTGPNVVDPSTLPACDPACGGAHCIDAALVPAATRPLLAACNGGNGFCAPDSFIASAGNSVPKTCTSVAGAEGRCLSTCLPPIAAQAAVLPKDVCATGEVCAPCFNPTATDPKAPTGACSLACDKPARPPVMLTCPWSGPAVIDPAQLPGCGCTGAHCLPSQFVPMGQQSQLNACTGGYCTPDALIQTGGDYKPSGCAPFAGVTDTTEGRCLSDCLPAVQQNATLEQSSCSGSDKCAPCANPFTGVATGACSLSSCDAPPATVFKFPNCCIYNGTPKGRCVPKTQIPTAQQSNLQADECGNLNANYLCVPNEQLPSPYGTPGQACTGSSVLHPLGYNGTCLSDCLSFPFGTGLAYTQGSCPANYTCIGCSDAPAGSPGC